MHLSRGCQLLGDLVARVPAAHNEHGALGHVGRRAVRGAVHLHDRIVELLGEGRNPGRLERTPGDDHLIGDERAVTQLDQEALVTGAHGHDLAIELDRQLERLGVAGEVLDHLIPAGVGVRVAGERHLGQAVVASRREQLQRVPPLSPRRGGLRRRLEDHEAPARTAQEVAEREAGLAAPDHGDVISIGGNAHALVSASATSKENIIPLSWCSAMWQCAIHRPGFVTSSRMSTVSPVRTSTVSLQTRLDSTSPSRARTRNRPAPWMWNGWCIGWSESISLTRRIFTRSPTRNCQAMSWLAASVERSISFQRVFAGVVILLTSTMSSSHSMPSVAAWSWACAWPFSWSWPFACSPCS